MPSLWWLPYVVVRSMNTKVFIHTQATHDERARVHEHDVEILEICGTAVLLPLNLASRRIGEHITFALCSTSVATRHARTRGTRRLCDKSRTVCRTNSSANTKNPTSVCKFVSLQSE